MIFLVQFGINKHSQIFQRLQIYKITTIFTTIFCSLWKICSCLFIPNCTRNHLITYTNRDVNQWGQYLVNININENFLLISLPGSAPHVMLKILELILVFHVLNENRTKTIEHDMLEWLLVLFFFVAGNRRWPKLASERALYILRLCNSRNTRICLEKTAVFLSLKKKKKNTKKHE